MSTGNTQQLACTGSTSGVVLTLTTANLRRGETMTFIFVEGNSGAVSCTVSFPANMHGATGVITTVNSVSTQEFIVSNNGTDLYAKAAGVACTSSCGTP